MQILQRRFWLILNKWFINILFYLKFTFSGSHGTVTAESAATRTGAKVSVRGGLFFKIFIKEAVLVLESLVLSADMVPSTNAVISATDRLVTLVS